MATRPRRSTRLDMVSNVHTSMGKGPIGSAAATARSQTANAHVAPEGQQCGSTRRQGKDNGTPALNVRANTNTADRSTSNKAKTNKSAPDTNTNDPRCSSIDAAKCSPTLRPPRQRKPRTTYSPTDSAAPTRTYRRRVVDVGSADESADELCRRLEGRVRSQVKQLRYLQTFLQAYEAEGWRRASREKLKPSKELDVARRKMVKAKRCVADTLLELQALQQRDPQIPYLMEVEDPPAGDEDKDEAGSMENDGDDVDGAQIYCSRCSLTDTTAKNDILLCDNEGCYRAFHQHCQVPAVSTDDIPPGDEPWFCVSCLSIFNALKLINNACDTTYEKIEDVFTELADEEQSLATGGDHGESTAEGTGEELEASSGDEEDDEDFTLDEQLQCGEDDESGSERSDSDSDGGHGGVSGDEGVLESNVSDDELKHLRKSDVIDANRRTTRSQHDSPSESWLGRRVAKVDDRGVVTMGVVVELHDDERGCHSKHKWRVVYYDGTMETLDATSVTTAMELVKHEKPNTARAVPDDTGDDVDRSLIVRGKRKRTRVDYRALNDLLFDGQEDSDVGDDGSHNSDEDGDGDGDNEGGAAVGDDPEADDDDYAPTDTSKAERDCTAVKRGRRARHKVDYRAMHEGVISF